MDAEGTQPIQIYDIDSLKRIIEFEQDLAYTDVEVYRIADSLFEFFETLASTPESAQNPTEAIAAE